MQELYWSDFREWWSDFRRWWSDSGGYLPIEPLPYWTSVGRTLPQCRFYFILAIKEPALPFHAGFWTSLVPYHHFVPYNLCPKFHPPPPTWKAGYSSGDKLLETFIYLENQKHTLLYKAAK